MRVALVLVLLAACEIPLPHHHGEDDDVFPVRCSDPRPADGCVCSGGVWACNTNTCGFWEGEDPVACAPPGATCLIYTWEHECDCRCGADGWWDCVEGTVGSRCPQGAPIDAGVWDTVDAILPDAAACSPVEAEAIGSHAGWSELSGNLSGGLGLGAFTDNQTLTFAFTGTTFAVTHERGPSIGRFTVVIDARAPVSVDGYQANSFDFTTTPIAAGLTNSSHTVTLTCVTATCTLDVFPITCN